MLHYRHLARKTAAMSAMSESSHPIGNPDIDVTDVTVAWDGYGVLALNTFDQRRRDGSTKTLKRESYQRGDSAAVLVYDRERRTILLTRQFRFPAYATEATDGNLIEAAAGMLEPGEPAATTVVRETEEELGVQIGEPEAVLIAFLSPGALTERSHLFAAPYTPASRTGSGGGLVDEGEDIEVLELDFDDALAMIAAGTIVDAKTIILLQWAALQGPFAR
jgi:nudix-type nucleoside diphosphatase (YffH/AdpP family)